MNIIPQPKEINIGALINNGETIKKHVYTNVKGNLYNYIEKKLGRTPVLLENSSYKFTSISNQAQPDEVAIPSDKINEIKEGYYLKLNSEGILIASATEQGLFYGLQTLMQLRDQEELREVEILDWPDNKMRGFHLELRYGMPRFERILEIIDEIAYYKFNTMLIEYENRIPLIKYPDITSHTAFTEEEMKIMQAYAAERFVDIIPLQQSLGHLEYILKKDKYYHLREVKGDIKESELPFSFNGVGFKHLNNIDEICATNKEACSLVEDLCDEVISKHPGSKYIHIGCDEAWNFFSCDSCRDKYGGDGRKRLFIDYINNIAKVITDKGKTPIIWDDMLRHFDEEDFKLLDHRIVIMSWLYSAHFYNKGVELIQKYKKAGFQVLGASSAKCSEGTINISYLDMPNMEERLKNMEMWADITEKLDIDGVVTTVWSNYTGTIAPPHPFFDTAWYPTIFSAEKYWNINASREGFYNKFIQNYFGVDAEGGALENNNYATYKIFDGITEKCRRHKYVAEVYKVMSLVSAYRIKSMAIQRELYKLLGNTTVPEKKMVYNRLQEVADMREYIKPMVIDIISKFYTDEDAEEFINSRFMMDEVQYNNILEKVDIR